MHATFSHTFEGKIWNTAFDEFSPNNLLAIETRNESTRKVRFSVVNFKKQQIEFEDLNPENTWWLGMIGIFNEKLLLHRYSDFQKPEPLGIIAIDAFTGAVNWRLDEWIFLNCNGEAITAFQINDESQPVYESFDLKTGVKFHKNTAKTPLNTQTEVFPSVHYTENNEFFPAIFKFLYRLLGIEAQKAVDYSEFQDKIIISYYIYRGNSLNNYLLVTDRKRNILLNDLIAETDGVGIDTFSVYSKTLLYIKNKNQLVSYEI